MTYHREATFDGDGLRLDEALPLRPGARVRVTIEVSPPVEGREAYSWLRTARALKLEGPSDASVRYEDDLYGKDSADE